MSITWEGLDEFEERLETSNAKKKEVSRKVAIALYREAENIMTKSKIVTPVSPGGGHLRASGYVASPRWWVNGAEVILGFGMDYGIYVHEITGPRKGGVGQKHFLSGPVKAAAKGLDRRLAVRIKGLLK